MKAGGTLGTPSITLVRPFSGSVGGTSSGLPVRKGHVRIKEGAIVRKDMGMAPDELARAILCDICDSRQTCCLLCNSGGGTAPGTRHRRALLQGAPRTASEGAHRARRSLQSLHRSLRPSDGQGCDGSERRPGTALTEYRGRLRRVGSLVAPRLSPTAAIDTGQMVASSCRSRRSGERTRNTLFRPKASGARDHRLFRPCSVVQLELGQQALGSHL